MDAMTSLGFTPAVGDTDLTAQQRSLLSLAHELGETRFAPRAATWDEQASFPFANYEDLREAGLLAMCVPSASTPVHIVEQMCMFQVSAVAPQKRPISAATIM